MMMERRNFATLLVALINCPATADGQGFGLNEIGSCAVSRAGSGVAAPCQDASAIFWNPGAATQQRSRWSMLVGTALIGVNVSYRADATDRVDRGTAPTSFPPHLFVNARLRPRVTLGVGLYVPYGLTSEWASDFPGRFAVRKASLKSIYLQPNLSWEVITNRLSIGGGPVIGHSAVELNRSLDLAKVTAATINGIPLTFAALGVPTQTEFATASVAGEGIAYGVQLGGWIRCSNDLTLGGRFLSALTFHYRGRADFKQLLTNMSLPSGQSVDLLIAPQFQAGALVQQSATTSITHPAQAQLGIAWSRLPLTTLMVDAVWVGWHTFNTLPVNFDGAAAPNGELWVEDFADSWAIKGSIDHGWVGGIRTRAGLGWIHSPAPDESVTALLPDMDRLTLATGVGIPVGGRLTLEGAYLRVQTSGRRGRIAEGADRMLRGDGFYRLDANVLSVGWRASW